MSNLFLTQLGFVCVITYLTIMAINSGYKRFQIRKQRAWNPSNFPVPTCSEELIPYYVERGISVNPDAQELIFTFKTKESESTRAFTYMSVKEAKELYLVDFKREELAFYERSKNQLQKAEDTSAKLKALTKRVSTLDAQIQTLLKDSEKPSV